MTVAAEPCVFVIFGGTGDLATRKLLPALYQLRAQGVTADGVWARMRSAIWSFK